MGLVNRSDVAATISVKWTDIALAAGAATVRDLWARANRGSFATGYSVVVPRHAIALLRVIGSDPLLATGYLSDQTRTYAANEWGPVEKDRSNGERASGDGHALTLGGVKYAKGLGAHAPGAIEFRPNGTCSLFTADIGIDDEVGGKGSVIFQVWADGRKRYDSSVMTGGLAPKTVHVDLTGSHELRLQLVAVESANYDHGDWADARVTCAR